MALIRRHGYFLAAFAFLFWAFGWKAAIAWYLIELYTAHKKT